MSTNISIRRLTEPRTIVPFFHELDEMFEQIRKRAFEKFLGRSDSNADQVRDWLEAEREIVFTPPLDLTEDDASFTLRLAVPGFEAADLRLSVLPEVVIIEGKARKEDEKTAGRLRIHELSARKLFRRIEMPSPVDVEKVTARLENGILSVTTPKATPMVKREIAIAASTK